MSSALRRVDPAMLRRVDRARTTTSRPRRAGPRGAVRRNEARHPNRPASQAISGPVGRRTEGGAGVLQRVRQGPARDRKPTAGGAAPDDRKQRGLGGAHEEAEAPPAPGAPWRHRPAARAGNEPHQQVEHTPEHRRAPQRAAGADQVAEHAAGKLEHRVAPGEPAEHQAELDAATGRGRPPSARQRPTCWCAAGRRRSSPTIMSAQIRQRTRWASDGAAGSRSRAPPELHSTSSIDRGQSSRRSRDIARSASSRPPVWQRAQ